MSFIMSLIKGTYADEDVGRIRSSILQKKSRRLRVFLLRMRNEGFGGEGGGAGKQ